MWPRVFQEFLPGFYACSNNKSIGSDLDHENYEPHVDEALWNSDGEALRAEYEDALRGKDKLEDKAKTNVVGVTISVSLIMGGNGLISKALEKFDGVPYRWGVYALLVVSVLYMMRAGLLSLQMLMDRNVVSQLDTSGNEEANDINKRAVAENRIRNIMRNNSVYASFACIRNSLCLLFVLFLIVLAPIDGKSRQVASMTSGSFFYTSESIQSFNEGVAQSYVEQLINDKLNSGIDASNAVTIVDDAEHIVVRFSMKDNVVNVYYIDRYL